MSAKFPRGGGAGSFLAGSLFADVLYFKGHNVELQVSLFLNLDLFLQF